MTDVTEFEDLDPSRLDGVETPANGIGFLLLKSRADPPCDDEWVEKFVSAEQRRKFAATGVAMANGAFPIPDEGHLRSAIGRLAEYKGDRRAAKRHIIRRAKALGLVHLLPKEWHVEKQTAPDKSVPRSEAERQTDADGDDVGEHIDPEPHDGGESPHVPAEDSTAPPKADGQGDTAPDKSVPKSEAERQTDAEKAGLPPEVDGEGSVAPDGEEEDAKAEDDAKRQTEDMEKKKKYLTMDNPNSAKGGDADSDPGSPAWEHKDVALGEHAEALINELREVVQTFTEREKAEGDGAAKASASPETAGAIRRSIQLLHALEKATTRPSGTKEIEDMTHDELVKLLDERDAARREAKKAAKAKAEKKARKEAKKESAAKGAEAPEAAESPQVAKLTKQLAKTQKKLEKVAATPVPGPVLNGAGMASMLRSPETRGSVFKELEDRVAAATTPAEAQQARRQLAAAKLIANENAMERDPSLRSTHMGPGHTPLITNSHALPEDRAVHGV